MGVNSRRKGKLGERLARDFLRSLGYEDARRGQQYSGVEGRDVVCLESLPEIHFEVKYGYGKVTVENRILEEWWSQAERDRKDGRQPILLWKPTRARQWRATLKYRGMLITTAGYDVSRMIGLILNRESDYIGGQGYGVDEC